MADNLSDDAIKQAVLAARGPSNLVTEADVEQPSIAQTLYDIGAAIPSAVSRYVSSVPERFSAATERVSQMSPTEIAQSLGSTAKTMIVDPAVQAFTAPGRAYRGEISQEQMLPEALNFTGMATLGGIPASALERSGGMMLGTSGTRMLPEAAAVELAKRELSPVGLYSHGAEAAMALPQATGSVDQMIAMLRKQPGVTEAELRNAGLLTSEGQVNPEWLSRGKIGREDIASHLQSRMPQVEETVLRRPSNPYPYRDPDEWSAAIRRAERSGNFDEAERLTLAWESQEGYGPSGTPKYEQYTLPGGENYREVLLRLPEKNFSRDDPRVMQEALLAYKEKDIPNLTDSQWKMLQARAARRNGEKLETPFQSSHWDDPNVLAHIRMADRTGPNGEKILHVEEVQSDWGQKGKKEGFADFSAKKRLNDLNAQWDKLGAERRAAEKEMAELPDYNDRFEQLRNRVLEIGQERDALSNQMDQLRSLSKSNIPSAPYVTSTQGWTDLALKRILKEAAEGGYDRVVWTPGVEQVGRYDLSKSLSKIAYNPDTGYFQALDLSGNPAINKKIATSELPDLVGKETAEKLLSQQPNNLGVHQLETSDLTIGGEGMKEYYDKILPNRLQSVAKKHDKNARLSYSDLPLSNKKMSYQDILSQAGMTSDQWQALTSQERSKKLSDVGGAMSFPSLDITPQMRESILKGQGAFQRGGRTMGNNAVDNALRMARDHFDYGGDVRGGDSPFMSRSDYGLRSAPTPSFREAEDRSMREYNRAIESGWSPTGGGSDRSQSPLENTLTGRSQGFEGAPAVNMPSNIGELLGYNRARQSMLQQQRQQQSAEQEAENQRIKDALAMASVGQTSFDQTGILPSGFPPVAKQPVYWGGTPPDLPQSTVDRALQLTQMPSVMGLPAGTTLGRTEMPLQAEMAGSPQETYDQMFARSTFAPQVNAQFAMAGSPYAVTPSAPTTMIAGLNRPAFPHTPTPQQAVQASVRPMRPVTPTPQTATQQVAQNVPMPLPRPDDLVAQAVAAASAPTFVATSGEVETPYIDVVDNQPPMAVLPGKKTAEVMKGVAAPNAPMPMPRPSDVTPSNPISAVINSIKSDLARQEGERINALEAAGKTATFPNYSSASDPLAAQRAYLTDIGLDPNNPADMAKVKARIIQQDGQDKVDYYTKSLSEALFGAPSEEQKVAAALTAAREGGGGDRASVQQAATQAPTVTPPPYTTELSEGNLALPHPEGLSAQQWADKYAGGDINKVHARVKFMNGAPTLEYYTV